MQFADYLIAHRGYPSRRPGNTLPSIQAALQAGARYIEVDVQMSRDGEIVLFHDRQLQRLCNQPGAVHDYSWQELQLFNVAAPKDINEDLPAIGITSLRDCVTLIQQHPDVTLFIELKRVSLEHFGIEAVVEQVLPLLQPIKQQAVLISYSLPALQYVQQISDVPLGVVIDDWRQRDQAAIQTLQPHYLFCNLASIPDTGELECAGCQLVVFECADPQKAFRLLHRGVKLVETFAIGEMLTVMASIGEPPSSA